MIIYFPSKESSWLSKSLYTIGCMLESKIINSVIQQIFSSLITLNKIKVFFKVTKYRKTDDYTFLLIVSLIGSFLLKLSI